MTEEQSSEFEFDIDEEGYDPLEDDSFDEEEDEEFEGPEIATQTEQPPTPAQLKEMRTPEERTEDLFKAMAPRRKTLLGILAFCATPQLTADLNARIDELQQNNFSVYSPANLTTLLENAGSIQKVTKDGEPYVEGENEPEVVEVDGVEYYQTKEAPEVYWQNTDVGNAYLESDKPLARLRDLLEADEKYLSIYDQIFEIVSAEGGAKIAEINGQIDHNPLLKKPRLYAPHFVDKLEKCDAIEWKQTWQITDIGRQGQTIIAEMRQAREQEAKEREAAQANEPEAAGANETE
ncbi:MAG: hypothetical protein LUB61_06360 [Eggerthellaceae bacterium]|nr:hypothetical protein [Eggerthellaceae bacterium]